MAEIVHVSRDVMAELLRRYGPKKLRRGVTGGAIAAAHINAASRLESFKSSPGSEQEK